MRARAYLGHDAGANYIANAIFKNVSDSVEGFFMRQHTALDHAQIVGARTRLIEDDGGIDYAGAMGEMPYGMHFGSPNQLYATFVKPFVDVAKTAAGKTAELSARAQAAAKVAFEALATSVVPVLSSDYGEIFADEKRKLDAIKQRYADVYGSTWSALGGNDVMMAAFMFAPWAFLSAGLIRRSPSAALSLVQMLGGGNAGIERFVSQVRSQYSGGYRRSEASAAKWNAHEEARMDTMSFEGLEFLGYVITEDTDTGTAKKKKKGRPQLVDVLTSGKLRKALQTSPIVQRMQRDGHSVVEASLRKVLQRAHALAKAKTIEDVERAVGKHVPAVGKLKKLTHQERHEVEDAVLKSLKAAMKKYYVDSLTQQTNVAINSGIARDNPFIKAYENVIKQIKAL